MGKVPIDQALKHARLLAERGDHARARKVYGKILRIAPGNSDAKAGLASLISTAASQSKSAAPLKDTSLSSLPALAGLLEKEQFEEVVRRAATLAEAHASSAAFWNLYGIALQQTRRYDAALSTFCKALTLEPGNEKISYNLAVLHQETEKYGAARRLFREVAEKRPEWAKPRFRLGQTLKSENRLQEALPHYQRAAELAPDDPKIQNSYGLVLSLNNEAENAIDYFRRAIELRPDYAEAHFNLANTLKKCDRILDAIPAYQKAVEINPEFLEAWRNLGNTFAVEEDYEECIACYDRVLALRPNDTAIMRARGEALISAGNIDEAQDYFLQLIPKFPEVSKFHYHIGRTYSSQGDLENSIKHFSAAYHLDPRDIGVFAALASMPHGALPDDIIMALKMNCEDVISTLPRSSRDFITAHVLRHLGRHEASWQHYIEANAAKFSQNRSLVRASIAEQKHILAKLQTLGSPETIHDDAYPVSLFIIGPSRSGKTRLERLLSTSPHVMRGYENPSFSTMAKKICSAHGLGAINRLGPLSEAGKAEFFEKYKKRLRNICQTSCIFTDTSPYRVLNAWEIADKLPDSVFIFVKRDPIDTAVDIFCKDYRSGNYYAYHPNTIRDHLIWYRNMRKTLSNLLGERAITIAYSDLLTDPQGQLRRVEYLLGRQLNCVVAPKPVNETRSASDPFRDLMMAIPKETSLDFLLEGDEGDPGGGSQEEISVTAPKF